MKNWYRASQSGQSMRTLLGNRFCLQRLVSVVKFIAERGLRFKDDENAGSPRNVFHKYFQNFFQANKKKMRCFWWPVLQQFHKSLTIVKYHVASKGVTRGKGAQFPGRQITMGTPNHCGEAPKSPSNVTNTFCNTDCLLPKDLKFEHGGAKLASGPGRNLTSLRPWLHHKVLLHLS